MSSTLHISADALAHNFRAIQAVAGEGTEVLAVIKADAYGHGAELCAPVLVDAGARWLGVTDAAEGARIRSVVGPEVRILTMCGFPATDAEAILARDLTPVIWTPAQVEALQAAAEAAGKRVSVHVEVDTGMGRQGCAPEDLAQVAAAIQAASRVQCEGLMTHLCESEVAGSAVTARQQALFRDSNLHTGNELLLPPLLHLSNTSAVDEGSITPWLRDHTLSQRVTRMVRTGLALYGYCLPLQGKGPHPHLARRLKPVLRWTTPLLQVRSVPAGTTVGYGATFTAAEPMRLGLLGVGYADGFRREASSGLGNGWVMIAGQRAPVLGRVSMNLTVVDVTHIAAAREGVKVTLLGEGVTAADHAAWCDTIPYEILCGLRGERQLV